MTTFQTAGPDPLTDGKNLYRRIVDRQLNELTPEALAIDVGQTEPVDWKGDLGDHKLVLLGDHIFMVAILKDHGSLPSLLKFDDAFNYVAGPNDFGISDMTKELHLDMGFCTDGNDLFVQFLHKNGEAPEDWGDGIYRFDQSLNQLDHGVVEPDGGTFVTGTAIVYVPSGQMDSGQDRLQIFSTNNDYTNEQRVGIHTFAADMDLALISGSRRDIVERELDTYFPTGPSWSAEHRLWFVGYTMENYEGELPDNELGPSFLAVFDARWNPVATLSLNNNSPAFRVMTQTADDDVYVVYDEMEKEGDVTASQAKLEHYRIIAPD